MMFNNQIYKRKKWSGVKNHFYRTNIWADVWKWAMAWNTKQNTDVHEYRQKEKLLIIQAGQEMWQFFLSLAREKTNMPLIWSRARMTQIFCRTLISSCSNSYSSVPRTATCAHMEVIVKFGFVGNFIRWGQVTQSMSRLNWRDVLTHAELPKCVSRFCSEKRVGYR